MNKPKKRIIILIVSVLALCIIFYAFVFKERIPEIRRLNEKHKYLSARVEQTQKAVRKYKELEVELDSVIPKWRELEALLPENEEMSELLHEIANAGKLSGVDFTLFEPLPPTPREFYTENPIGISTVSSYHQLGRFLSRIARVARPVKIKDLEILGHNFGTSARTVQASFNAITFTLSEGQDEEGQNEQK